MTPERWAMIEQEFEAFAALPAGEHAARLAVLYERDPEVADTLQRMLATTTSTAFMEHPIPGDARPDPPEFPRFSNYQILAPIGEGAMGKVYKARQQRPPRDVALKVFRPGVEAHQEAAVLAGLKHPGIVTVFEANSENGRHYFSMELVDGIDLAEAIRRVLKARSLGSGMPTGCGLPPFRSRGSVRAIATIGSEIADAMAAAHRAGVWHCDLKPSNILLTTDHQIRIVDFGIARSSSNVDVRPTDSAFRGAPPYMSPERLRSQLDRVDQRTDVYSIGVVLYELLTLRRPFDGRTNREIIDQVLSGGSPTSIRRINALVPGDLQTIVEKAMSPEPADRYRTMEDLRDDLLRFLANETIVGRPQSLTRRARNWVVRRRRAVVGVLLTLVAAALLLRTASGAAIARDRAAIDARAARVLAHGDIRARSFSDRLAAVDLVRSFDRNRLGDPSPAVASLAAILETHRSDEVRRFTSLTHALFVSESSEQDREAARLHLLGELIELRSLFPDDPDVQDLARPERITPKLSVLAVDEHGAGIEARVFLASIDPVTTGPRAAYFIGRSPVADQPVGPGYYRATIVFDAGGFREVPCVISLARMRTELRIARLSDESIIAKDMVRLPSATYQWPHFKGQAIAFSGITTEIPSFLMDRYEVTNGDYRRFLDLHPNHTRPFYWPVPYDASLDQRPVAGITWQDATDYAKFVGKRLPTLAEWLYAACGAEGRRFPWASTEPERLRAANVHGPSRSQVTFEGCSTEYLQVVPVSTHPEATTPEGLFHMFGNVQEWTESLGVTLIDNTAVPDRQGRFIIGGAWDALAVNREVSSPINYLVGDRSFSHTLGFRCARSVKPAAESK